MIAEKFKRAARRLVVQDVGAGRVCYQVRRPSVLDLAEAGVGAVVPGMGAVAEALSKVTTEEELAARLAECSTDEQREEARRAVESHNATIAAQLEASYAQNPNVGRAILDRADAYVIFSVEAAGIVREDEAGPVATQGVLDPSVAPADVCVELAPGVFLEPVKFVRGAASAEAGELSLRDCTEAEVAALAILIHSAFQPPGVAALAATFRRGLGHAGDDGPVGPAVRAAPERPPGHSAARGGERD